MTEALTEAESDSGWGGPDPALLERVHMAMQAPSWGDLSIDEGDELRERIIAARTFTALPAADQAFIAHCEGEVRAGLSKTWQRYTSDDWAAEDAAVEGPLPEAKGVDFDEPDDVAGDLPSADDDGWVGV